MDRECKMLQLCGFVKKHCSGNDLAGLWYRAEYCTGEKQDQCQRKQYMIEHGKVPVNDMAPTGEIMQTVECC